MYAQYALGQLEASGHGIRVDLTEVYCVAAYGTSNAHLHKMLTIDIWHM